MDNVLQSAAAVIAKCGSPKRIMCALSGGADSTCLLLVLKELSADMGFELTAAHINHSLRGEESDRDEKFSRRLAEENGVPFKSARVNVPEYCRINSVSEEEGARELRYKALREMAAGAVIATAHNLNDNAETVMFNIIRGTGIKGVCGIPYKRDDIIRPLLDVSREEIEKFLSERSQGFVTDSTNLTDDHTRNIIRHRLIPAMVEINPDLLHSVRRLSLSALETTEHLENICSAIAPADLPEADTAVRKYYIAKMLSENGITPNSLRINDIDDMVSGRRSTRYTLDDSTFAVTRKGVLAFEKKAAGYDYMAEIKALPFEVFIPEYDKTVKISCCDNDIFTEKGKIHRNLTTKYADYDKIQCGLVLRNKRDGDKIRLAGREHRTQLKKHYNALKLSAFERSTALVLCSGEELIWSEYGGFSDRVTADDKTTKLLSIEVIYGKDQ